MKSNKSIIFSLFFLTSFLVSFGINTFHSISLKKGEFSVSNNKRIFDNLHSNSATFNDFLSEEIEEDDDLNTTLSFIPYILADVFLQRLISYRFCFKSKSIILSTPIYISVCNFRV
jgi:hypothetical protein